MVDIAATLGSFLKALYTMFEVTHSGSWPAVVRPVIEKVSPWYVTWINISDSNLPYCQLFFVRISMYFVYIQ